MAGTPIAVQQKLMRHTEIRTTMNLYGDVETDAMVVGGTEQFRLTDAERIAGLASD
jgi:hypothetical protein